MRNKRFLSTVAATALVATTMAMPVMAADGGKVDVTVSTKDAIIRVCVPTTLAVAVDQFEKGDAGSQIYSENFTIENKSDVPVEVDVTSTATIASIVPVASTSAAKYSTGNDAWLAVTAETADDTYGAGIDKLTDASANVTTFTKESDTQAKAVQTFYLDKGSGGNATYNYLDLADADKTAEAQKLSYANFYELDTATLASNDDAGLKAALAGSDIYEYISGTTLTLLEKGKEDASYDGTHKYYTLGAKTERLDLTQGKKYVYAESSAAGGKTAFRYIGKLSDGKSTWTKDDISKIEIKYDIIGVTGSNYPLLAAACDYGLYKKEKLTPQVSINDTGLISFTGLTAEKNYKSMSIITDGQTYDINVAPVTWDTTNWSEAEGGNCSCQLGEQWMNSMKGVTTPLPVLEVTLSDDSKITYQFVIPED